MSRYCSPVSPSHMDHLFHSCDIFSLGWHIFAHSHIFCGILCVIYAQHRQDYCDLSIGKSPVALWMLRRRRVKGAPAILASAFTWNLMKVILISVLVWKFKMQMPSWHQPLLGTWWKLSWSRSLLESLRYKCHLGLSLKVILLLMAVEQICKISFPKRSHPYLSHHWSGHLTQLFTMNLFSRACI